MAYDFKTILATAGVTSLLMSGGAALAASPQDVARLGKDLTPMGAERAGNADGSIPAWDGKPTPPPAGFSPYDGYADPYAGEQPLFVITADNYTQYQDKLIPGQIEMLKRFPETYKIKVYPSHRPVVLPKRITDTVAAEAAGIVLASGGNGVLNIQMSRVPFPIPENGLQAIWNHVMRYRGGTFVRYGTEFPVQSNGDFTTVKRTEWWARAAELGNPEDNRLSYYRNMVTAPSSIAGEAILSHDPLDQSKESRSAWTYNPGQRRVLRAPEVAHDSPGTGTDGLRTMDDYDGFNGSPERFDWKLVGKQEKYIAYNSYALSSGDLKYEDIVKTNHINMDLARYELHRVWVVEATLKPGERHIYGKRVYYIDEDTWQIAHKDAYDGRGDLWRVHEFFTMYLYDVQVAHYAGNAFYDLQARRYLVNNFNNEEKPTDYGIDLSFSQFSPAALRRLGN